MAAIFGQFDDFCPLDQGNPIENKSLTGNELYSIIKIRFYITFLLIRPLIIRYITGTMCS